ncbi:MAG: helix-turn-helix transcriptional regulator [Oscillospiraceae bacterium]|nr:helix-turn-helix transcriptional regulator [Oscillospiraceae bacterium]
MNLGENIYRLRMQRNMSQGALADALEISRQSVSKWENNSATPELDKLIKMSELFNVTLDELVGKDATTPPPQTDASQPVIQNQTPPYRTIGVILTCFGLLTTLLMSFFSGFAIGVILGLPFTIVGCILISSTEGLLFKCAWAIFAVYAPLSFYFMLNYIGFGIYIRWGILVVWFAALIIASICMHRKSGLSGDSKKLMIGSIIVSVILLILLGIANQALYRHTGLFTIP